MQRYTRCGVLLVLALPAATLAAAPGNCKNIPLVVTISPTYVDGSPAAILPDFPVSYVDGVDKVKAEIDLCGPNPSGNFTMDTLRSNRTIGFDFSVVVASNSDTPGWVFTTPHLFVTGSVVVWNAWFRYDPSVPSDFTTRAEFNFTGPDKNTYSLRYMNPFVDAPSVGPQPYDNLPFPTARIRVQHVPVPSTWYIFPDPLDYPPHVATLVRIGKKVTVNAVNAGQFIMPSYIVGTPK